MERESAFALFSASERNTNETNECTRAKTLDGEKVHAL
jgi:hypothetical protein